MKHVYFMKPVGAKGPVKIGCTDDQKGRVDNLMSKSPFLLEIVASFPGNHIAEARLHRRFIASNTHSEWFLWTPELQTVIDAVLSGEFNIETMPEPLFLNSKGGRWAAIPHRERNRDVFERALSGFETRADA